MAPNGWREVIGMPVISRGIRPLSWLGDELEKAFFDCGTACMTQNGGLIATCLSGGLDSSLALAMLRVWFNPELICAFTIGGSENHPDVQISREVAKHFGVDHFVYIPNLAEIDSAERILSKVSSEKQATRGDCGVFLLYKYIAARGIGAVLAHDGIDELMGGYWKHRSQANEEETREVFEKYWLELADKHLIPLEKSARYWGVDVLLPYLQKRVVRFISEIPLASRTSRAESKMPLRKLARQYCVPASVISRSKRGFCDALDLR